MSDEVAKIDCNIICDLMVVYASGEASAETIAFIESHIAECPECQAAYEAAQRGEDLLAELEPATRPIQFDGRKILIRIQRIFFGVITFVLFLTVLTLAVAERWVVRGLLGLPLPRWSVFSGGAEWITVGVVLLGLFGALVYWRSRSEKDRSFLAITGAALLLVIGMIAYKFMLDWNVPGAIVAGTLLFALYGFVLYWRTQQKSESFGGEFLLSLESAVPLLVLTLAALTLVGSGGFTETAFILGLLILAIFFTLLQISKLPYMIVITPLILLVSGILIIINAVSGVVSLFDLKPQWPAELGHPQELSANFNLKTLGYTELETRTPTELDTYSLPEDAEAREVVYTRSGGETASVIVIEFADKDSARDFLSDWERNFSHDFYSLRLDFSGSQFNEPDGDGEHPLHWWLELPGVWFGQQGQIVRSYDESTLTAYNAWQIDEWVTVVATKGSVVQALPLSRQIKELVSKSYQP